MGFLKWRKLRGVRHAMALRDVKMMLGVAPISDWRLTIVTIFVR